MARQLPKLCLRTDGRYYATDPGSRKPVYFGRDKGEAQRLYQAWAARLAIRRTAPARSGTDASVAELCTAFLEMADAKYVKRGKPTSTPDTFRQAIRFLVPWFDYPVSKFTADELLSVRDAMLAHRTRAGKPLCRTHINASVSRLVSVFRWGRRRRLVPRDILADLVELEPLQRGEAPDNPKVLPVPEADVLATAAAAKPRTRAMLLLQLATGLRPGEVCSMRGDEIDRTSIPWAYHPGSWKTDHHGHGQKVVYLGPKAREILTPILAMRGDGFLFPSRRLRHPCPVKVKPYWSAVKSAAERAGVPHWHPHQLRHTAGTRIRAAYGLDAVQAVLGHEQQATSERYAEKDDSLARRVAEETG